MSATNPQQMLAMLNGLVQPWHAALANPAQAQQQVPLVLRESDSRNKKPRTQRVSHASACERNLVTAGQSLRNKFRAVLFQIVF